MHEIVGTEVSSAEAFSKAIDSQRRSVSDGGIGQSSQVRVPPSNPMRAECVKAELDSAECALEEAWKQLEALSMHLVGIPPEPNRSGWPGGDSIADRSVRVKLRAAELLPVMNVLQQRLA